MISADLIVSALISGIFLGGLYALLALGTNIIVGIMRIINLAQGSFAMLGMFTAYWLFQLFDMPPLASLPVAFVIMFVAGVLIAKFVFKRVLEVATAYTVLLTYGLQQIILNGAQLVWTGDFRRINISYGVFRYFGISVSGAYLLAFITAAILACGLYLFLMKTKVGKAVRAVSQDAEASSSLGIDVDKVRMLTAGLGLGLAGLAGVIFSIIYYVYPYIGQALTMTTVIICVLGGLGDYKGAFFGALIIGLTHSLSPLFLPSGYIEAVGFLVFILMLLLKPTGLFGKGR